MKTVFTGRPCKQSNFRRTSTRAVKFFYLNFKKFILHILSFSKIILLFWSASFMYSFAMRQLKCLVLWFYTIVYDSNRTGFYLKSYTGIFCDLVWFQIERFCSQVECSFMDLRCISSCWLGFIFSICRKMLSCKCAIPLLMLFSICKPNYLQWFQFIILSFKQAIDFVSLQSGEQQLVVVFPFVAIDGELGAKLCKTNFISSNLIPSSKSFELLS